MSSLFASLNVAVSGLSAQSASIGNISDNLANSQTTGYKEIGTSFKNLVTSSNASSNSPGGVTATPSYQNDVQGTLTTTSSTSNLAISGQGFFATQTAVQTATGTTQLTGNTYYTRQGDFTLNKDGYLVNSSGYYLNGYAIDSTTGTVNSSTPSAIQISSLLDNPVPTSTVTYSANLPASATAGSYTSSASSIEIYDSLGNTHQMSVTWSKGATNSWSATISTADGGGTGTAVSVTVPVTFASDGTISVIGTGSGYTVNSSATNAAVSFNLSFPGATANQAVSFNFGTYGAAGGVTQYANSSGSSGSVAVASFQQNGLGEGSYSSIGINSSGVVTINYSNGSTRQIYQIPVVTFNSPDNLQRVTGGAYQATLASGTPNYYTAGTFGAGTMSSSSLESSDVDISTEFTALIQAQQIYSANAKVVTTVNAMLTKLEQAVQ